MVDMWKSFLTPITDVFPHAAVVHDKYHVVSYLNKAVNEVRYKENKSLPVGYFSTCDVIRSLLMSLPPNGMIKSFRQFMMRPLWVTMHSVAILWHLSRPQKATK